LWFLENIQEAQYTLIIIEPMKKSKVKYFDVVKSEAEKQINEF
jgi:hypothetical protein